MCEILYHTDKKQFHLIIIVFLHLLNSFGYVRESKQSYLKFYSFYKKMYIEAIVTSLTKIYILFAFNVWWRTYWNSKINWYMLTCFSSIWLIFPFFFFLYLLKFWFFIIILYHIFKFISNSDWLLQWLATTMIGYYNDLVPGKYYVQYCGKFNHFHYLILI